MPRCRHVLVPLLIGWLTRQEWSGRDRELMKLRH